MRAALVVAALVVLLLWRPVLYPTGKAAVLLLDVYSPSLVGSDVAEAVTPEPVGAETSEVIGGIAMRVSWWRPAWGQRHPAILFVNGATPVGNDNEASRAFGVSLARAGYLVMLPELPFLREGRLDLDAPRVVDAAFAKLRAMPETEGQPVGAFGASVGAGLMLSAAGRYPAIGEADHLTVLGGYFDLDTYVAAIAAHATAEGPWEPSEEARTRIPPALDAALASPTDAAALGRAFAAGSYAGALDALRGLSPAGRALFDALSPSEVWGRVRPPVFWIHDPEDSFEPLAEAHAAQAAPRDGRFALLVPRLVQHAAVGEAVRGRDAAALAAELWKMLTFTLDVLRIAG